MPLFHLFTWNWRVEGLFVLWGLTLLVGLALFKKRELVKEVVAALDVCDAPASAPARVRYRRSFAGYGLRG
jgi:hypothetical protein